ncbi:MAG: response regulator [Chitinophagaceae bacterium]
MTKLAIVDDHELLRNGIAAIINTFENFSVMLSANNGKDFIEQLKSIDETPDIVLLDITMPVMNGYDTAAWIKAKMPDTKILVLSMMDNESAIIQMLKNGATGYILKDSKPAILKEALISIKDHGFYMNELINGRMLHYVSTQSQNRVTNSPHNLNEKELTFLKLICSEYTYKEIADQMHASPRTVDSYRDNLFEKLQIKSRVGLVMFAIRNGIVII